MARLFRYRYVDFGTSFAGDPHTRALTGGDDAHRTLFANELATDVGRSCWGANEPLAIIDHHFQREAQFPSASAAVLHKASQIRERFTGHDLVWLVTHKEPDFDAFCSMYLARWIIDDPNADIDWRKYGLHTDAWMEVADGQKVDWLNLNVAAVPDEYRWALLLAGYASMLEARRRISCPTRSALHSVLAAALKRGRNYLTESSGAVEFFDEVRSVLLDRDLNPVFDSVLENSSVFAPERTVLQPEPEAYQRDMQRSRRSTVYLPESEAPSPDFFKSREFRYQDHRRASELDAEHLLLADTFRIPTDGIYLRDPECLLFKEWARLDLENSSLGAGFEFTAIAYSHGRPEAPANTSDYQFSIDPERANGRHLFTVWSRLQTQEVEALRAQEQDVSAIGSVLPGSGCQPPPTLGSLLADPWAGGQSQFGNVVSVPHRGTLIGPPGVRSDLRDDPVVEAVRTELEGSIYSAASLVAGPQVTVFDFSGSGQAVDIVPRPYDLNSPLEIPAPPESYFRFAAIGLRSDVPITTPNLAMQIGETLWQVLYPELPGGSPQDFVDVHLVIGIDTVGVWGDRGIAIAQKQDGAGGVRDGLASELRAEFAAIVSMIRDVDRLTARWVGICNDLPDAAGATVSANRAWNTEGLQSIINSAGELARRFTQIKHVLTLPDHDLLRRFYESVRVDQLSVALRDMTACASRNLDQHELAVRAHQADSRADAVAQVQTRLEWLEVLVVGLLAVGIIDVITRQVTLPNAVEDALVLVGGPLFLGFTAWLLKPWQRKTTIRAEGAIARPPWIVIAVAAACLVGWLAGLVHTWMR